ncbi:MAG: hypothetical protein Q4P31_00010 [Andreesenia angusta]|nr:hypothetical protein [Andreesenia angusta]
MTINDISTINRLNDTIKLRNQGLNNRKNLLDKEKHVIEEKTTIDISKRIFDAIEEEIEGSLNLLKYYLKKVYDRENVKYYSDHIYILCRYIKQRAQMSVLEIKKERLDKKRVEKVFNDLIGEFRYNELDFFIVIAGEDNFSLEELLILHEYIYNILLVHYECENTSIYCRIFNQKDNIKMVLNLNLNSEDKTRILDIVDLKLRNSDCGTVVNIIEEDENLNLEFQIKKVGDYIVD